MPQRATSTRSSSARGSRVTEVIPYLGPWLGAIPPLIYALVVHPISALWVALLFLVHPPGRGAHRRAERDGQRAAAAPAARHLRPARRRRDLRARRACSSRCRCSRSCARSGSSSPSGSSSSRGRAAASCRSRSSWTSPPAAGPACRRCGVAQLALDEHLPGHPPAAAAAHRRAARPRRARRASSLDDLVHAALRRAARRCANERAARASSGTRSTRSCASATSSLALGVAAVILFGIPEAKDDEGSGAWIEDGIVQQALRALRPRFPELAAAHRRLPLRVHEPRPLRRARRGGEVDNDATLELLARTAVSHVEAGADVVCPSDMMDGRVGAIRRADAAGSRRRSSPTPRSTPPRSTGRSARSPDSTPAFGDRRGYQMDPGNVREALRECELDVAEGADVLMVKPALPYLDVIRAVRERFDLPARRLQRLGRVRDGQGRRRRRRPRRARGRARVADRDPPRRRGRRLHVLGEGARARGSDDRSDALAPRAGS